MKNFERRFYPFNAQVKAVGDLSKRPELVGYAAVFDTLTEEMFGFMEKIARGAFKESIANDDIRMLFNHDQNFVLGRNRSGTLRLQEDDKGLWFEAIPPNTQLIRDLVLEPIKSGDVTQNSFGFFIQGEEWTRMGNSKIRILTKIRLFDISPVTFPAYPQTEISIRGQWGETRITDSEVLRKINRALRKIQERRDEPYFDEEG